MLSCPILSIRSRVDVPGVPGGKRVSSMPQIVQMQVRHAYRCRGLLPFDGLVEVAAPQRSATVAPFCTGAL